MLEIQKYLQSGKTPQDLQTEFGINSNKSPDGLLMCFKYDQIDSPKTHPIVREARGIVLENGSWNLVAKAFNRFFNVGEVDDEWAKFNWDNFTATEKVDGSLQIVYHRNSQWHINTSGSFGYGEVNDAKVSWRDLFLQTSKLDFTKLNPSNTYVFELCTPTNQVVKYYQPTVFLIGKFSLIDIYDYAEDELDDEAKFLSVPRPRRFNLKTKAEVQKFMLGLEDESELHEGIVLRDSTNMRYKWKTLKYTARHHLKDNGNLRNPSRIVPLILAGDKDEIVSQMPEFKEPFEEIEKILNDNYNSLKDAWFKAKDITLQKDFALAVKDHKLSGILFGLRKKMGATAQEVDLRAAFRSDVDQLVKKLF